MGAKVGVPGMRPVGSPRARHARAALGWAGLLALASAGGRAADRVPAVAPCSRPWARAVAAGPVRVVCASGPDGYAPVRGALGLLFGKRLDANRTPSAELTVLPGIGSARAAAWARARRRRPFCSLEDLLRIPGIGPRTLARLRASVTVAPRPAGCGSDSRPRGVEPS